MLEPGCLNKIQKKNCFGPAPTLSAHQPKPAQACSTLLPPARPSARLARARACPVARATGGEGRWPSRPTVLSVWTCPLSLTPPSPPLPRPLVQTAAAAALAHARELAMMPPRSTPPFPLSAEPAVDSSRSRLRLDVLHPVRPLAAAGVEVRGRIGHRTAAPWPSYRPTSASPLRSLPLSFI
jgi:hypothetical protein